MAMAGLLKTFCNVSNLQTCTLVSSLDNLAVTKFGGRESDLGPYTGKPDILPEYVMISSSIALKVNYANRFFQRDDTLELRKLA